MYPLQGTPDGPEPDAHQDQPADTKLSPQLLIWTIRLLAVAYIATILFQLSQEDEIPLHLLQGTIKVLQAMARILGGWALTVEAHYNEYVSTLH